METKKIRNGGFTLLETLLTVAILIILLGVSAVGVVYYRDYLKITELDNAARDIYMAAENRAVLLQNSGAAATRLKNTADGGKLEITKDDGTKQTVSLGVLSNATETETLNDLLPVGVIDPTLRAGHFYILYDKSTRHVFEVFYAKESFSLPLPPKDEKDEEDMKTLRGNRSGRVSLFRGNNIDCLVGYYGSEVGETIGTKPLPTPGVEVFIENGEELTLTVKYTMPDNLPAGVKVTRKPTVTLKYDDKEVKLLSVNDTGAVESPYNARLTNNIAITDITNPMSATYTWVLDSLEQDSSGNYIKQFKDLKFKDKLGNEVHLPLGGNFTVTAGLTLKADGWIDSAYYAQSTDNSLFAKGSATAPTNPSDPDPDPDYTNTALIANLRHLQNLCADFSKVDTGSTGITKAEQIADIECKEYKNNQGDVLNSAYKFTPITNGNLSNYNGQNKYIRNLSTKTVAAAGLFGTVSTNLTVQNTRVCWTRPEALVKDDAIVCAVSGTNAGGLIGAVTGGTVKIENSFAATTVQGTAQSGGLVGSKTGGGALNIEHSYADCYLTGSGKTGGLIGQSDVASTLTDCYAAGFIMEPVNASGAAGLLNATGANVQNCYSVVRVVREGRLERPATPLYGSVGMGAGNVLYLYTVKGMPEGNHFEPAFEYEAGKPETHVYDLRHRLSSAVEALTPPYPFPGLDGLPHYGDWAELNVDPVPAGLAYYETYSGNATCMAGQYENEAAVNSLRKDVDNPVVTKDGYALVFKDGIPSNACAITYGGQEWTLNGLVWTKEDGSSSGERAASVTADGYTLVPLPDEIVTDKLAGEGEFYRELEYQGKPDGTDTEKEASARSFYFNPHFAKTVTAGTVTVETVGGVTTITYTKPAEPNSKPTTESNPVYVRTARHLYDLSLYQDPYAYTGYHFKQELDIDYAAYTGYGTFTGAMPFRQDPIGTGTSADANSPFVGVYDGGFHIIQGVFFRENGNYLGLFGQIGKDGTASTLENVVYKMDPAETLEAGDKVSAVGALAGKNYGTILNCAVYGVNMKVGGCNYTGGLLGYNQGTVTNCAAEAADLSASGTAGGLVGGQNPGSSVLNSYAVGRLESESGVIAGLVGSGSGGVSSSYAAVDLIGSTDRYGLCGTGVKADGNSGWLKDVFVYRGKKYNITATTQYRDPEHAVVFETLKAHLGSAQTEAKYTIRNIPDGMAYGVSYAGKTFPYRTGVTTVLSRDPDTGLITGKHSSTPAPVHYGLWPMPLPVGLAYYETYSVVVDGKPRNVTHMAGQYENTKVMSLQTEVVTKDGYGLVFEGGEDDIPAGDYTIKYGNVNPQNWTLTKTAAGESATYVWTRTNSSEKQKVDAITADGYTLIPLPNKIVIGPLSEGDVITAKFYQKLIYGDGLFSARTFYFNPHFAGRLKDGKLVSVEAGTVESNAVYRSPEVPTEPVSSSGKDGSIAVWADSCPKVDEAWGWRAVSVRTARHFYALSRFQNTYVVEGSSAKKYYFKQALDVNYNAYEWYGKEKEIPAKHSTDDYYVQAPIGQGTRDDGFKGAYNGGGHVIENVFYATSLTHESGYDISGQSQYVGLFRYVEYISNVNYVAPGGIEVAVENKVDKHDDKGNISGSDLLCGAKVGTLMGGCFRSFHCTATLKDFTVKCSYGDRIFVGGLSGYSNKMNGCSVVIEGCLMYDGNVPLVYVGGLQALAYQEVVNCTSKVESLVVNGGKTVYAGGLVGNIAHDDAKSTTRTVAGCATEIKDLRVNSTGTSYAGGLIGYNCEGGRIYASYAVGAIGAGDSSTNHHYSGLVGQNENVLSYTTTIQNCYSAVGLLAGSQSRNYNFCPNNPGTITNCCYLTGSWYYGGKQYTALSNTTNYATGKTYNELAGLTLPKFKDSLDTVWGRKTEYTIPDMKAAGGTGYPFPVNTGNMVVRYLNSSGGEDSRYEHSFLPYPGGDWPKNPS